MWKKRLGLLTIGFIIVIMGISSVSAITVNPGVYYRQGNDKTIYGFSTTMQFNIFILDKL